MKPSILSRRVGAIHAPAKTILLCLALVAIGRWLATPACGAVVPLTWVGGSSWSDRFNWDPQVVPQNGENLIFFGSGFVTGPEDMVNDLTDLTVRSMFFDLLGNTLQTFDWNLKGNTLGIIDNITLSAVTDWRIHISCGLRLEGDATFRLEAASGFNPRLELHLDGPIDLNGHNLEVITGANLAVNISGAISGSGNIIFSGASGSTMEFSGTEPNTFQGTLIVGSSGLDSSSCKFILNKQLGVAAVPDTLVIRHGGVAQLNSSEQIGDNAGVEIHSGGQFLLVRFFETIGNLTLRDDMLGGDNRPPVVDTGAGQLGLIGSLTCSRASLNFQAVPTIRGALNLTGLIPIDLSGTPDPGLEITARIVGDGFNKTGPGTLRLSGINSFSGDVAVTEGTVEARNQSAFAPAAPPSGVHLNGGNIVLQNVPIPSETLVVNSSSSMLTAIGQCSWDGPIILNATLQIVALDPTFSDVPFSISSSISGPGGMDLLSPVFGVGNVRLGGTGENTFTGPLTVNCQRLELNKPSLVRAYAGPLIVGQPNVSALSEVRWLNAFQNIGGALTLFSNGLVNLNNFNEDFGPVTFNGGRVETGSGTFAIFQPLTVNAADSSAIINGFLGLAPRSPAIFNVGDGAPDCDLIVNAVVSGTPTQVVKQGPGTMCLAAVNTYSSTTLVEGGILDVNNGSSLGSPADTLIFDNATLRLSDSGTLNENFRIAGAGLGGMHGAIEVSANGGFTLTGSVLMDAASTINVPLSAGLSINGVISGSGPLTKIGSGSLILGGNSGNTFSGDTLVKSGALFPSKPNGTAAVPGNLVLGPASPTAVAFCRFLQSGGIGGSTVTVNANSLLDLNGFILTLAQLNLNDGGAVQTGTGRLNFSAGAVVEVGSLSARGSHASSSISGNLGLPANHSMSFHVRTYAFFFPFATGPELDVPALISVNGFESPIIGPAGFSKEGVGRMRLGGNNTYKGVTLVNGGTLQVDGAQPQSAVQVSNGARLQGGGIVGRINFIGSTGVIAPGNGPGILTCSNFNVGTFDVGVLQIELNGATPGANGYDQLNVHGLVKLDGISLNASLGFASTVGQKFVIINNDGFDLVGGTFANLPSDGNFYIGGEQFTISYNGGTGNDVVLSRIPTPPLPLLTIQNAPPSAVRLLWPTNAAGFGLQTSTNLTPTNWSAALLPLSVIGSNNVVLDSTTNSPSFYRLFHP